MKDKRIDKTETVNVASSGVETLLIGRVPKDWLRDKHTAYIDEKGDLYLVRQKEPQNGTK